MLGNNPPDSEKAKKQTTELMEFPCRFAIKAFGKDKSSFQQTVFDLVQREVPELEQDDLSCNTSSAGTYIAVTVTIIARSRAQLDAIYQHLSDAPSVIMSL